MRVPQRRIDDRIRGLCAQMPAAAEGDIDPMSEELLTLVHQKIDRLKRRAARLLLNGEHLEEERRQPFQLGAKSKSKKAAKPTIPDISA